MHALFTGSFDPITAGHYELIRRASALFTRLTVAVCVNSEKSCMFDAESRLRFVNQAIAEFPNVRAVTVEGWAADAVRECGANVIVKGLRDSGDFNYEKLVAEVNRRVSGVETLFLPAAPEYGCVCSAAVREMIRQGKDYTDYIPENTVLF